MKKRFLMILIAIFIVSFGLFVTSCGETSEELQGDYAIEGVTDISISSSQTECDFLKGVVGWNGQTLTDVSVDSSAVKFGTVGAYEITYTLGNVNKKATVRVYGTPEITGDAEYETYYSTDINVFADVVGKDSFGVELEVTTNHEFEVDKFGRVVYGDHFFRYYVTDAVGNTAYLDRKYTVLQHEDYKLNDLTITVENPEAKIDISGKTLSYVVYNGEKIPASEYAIRDGFIDLSYYAVDLGIGKHDFSLSFEGGYSDVTIDMQITPTQFYGKPIVGEQSLWLFNTYLDGDEYGNCVVWDEEQSAYHFINNYTDQYDDRGFYMDAGYFSNLIARGKAVKMKFEFKMDIEDTTASPYALAFYAGFIPNWYDAKEYYQLNYSADYQTVTIDLTKVDKNGANYKTLFMLATYGGFYVKNIQFEF